jgi:ribose 5-phosphate isomerase B
MTNNNNIAIGCDHRGLELKERVKTILAVKGYNCRDFGTYTEESIDYPDIAGLVCNNVTEGIADKGILICSTGAGMRIAANKFNGIRAVLCFDSFLAQRAREHNDANVLCLASSVNTDVLSDIVTNFLEGVFEGDRHQRRIDKIKAIELANKQDC